MVEADRGEHGAVLLEAGEPGAVAAFLGPAAVGTGQPDVDDAVRGGHPPTDLFQPLQAAQELGAEPGAGLLLRVGLHLVVGAGGFGQ